MVKKQKKKLRLSAKERERRRKQALKNFGHRKKRTVKRKRSSTKNIKRRKTTSSSMAKRKKTRTVRSVKLDLKGVGLVLIGEPILDSFLARFGMGIPDDFLKAGLGWYLSRRGSTMQKSAGYTLMILGARNIIRGSAGNILGNVLGNGNNGAVQSAVVIG